MRMLLLDVLENLENQKEIIKSMVKDIKAMIPEVQDTTKIRMDGGGTE